MKTHEPIARLRWTPIGRLGLSRITRFFRHLAFAAALVCFANGLAAQDIVSELERFAMPRSGISCPSPEQYSPERPDPPGTPTTVGLGIFLHDVSNLSDADQTLDLDIYVVSRWRDPRLADPARGEEAAECPPPQGAFWMPAVEPENLRSSNEFYKPRYLIDAKGVVTYALRIYVKVSYPLDFREFPFDEHDWAITLWPVFSRSDEIVFHALGRVNGRNERLSIQGWEVGAPQASVSVTERIARPGAFARFDTIIHLKRDWSYYAWKLGLPLTLIVLMAYGVYYIPTANVAQQIALGMTSMLTFIAYMLALGGGLPKISYLTRADQFFIGSAALVFLGLVKAIVTVSVAQGKENRFMDRINQIGKWIYPCGMLLNVVNAFFL